MTEVVRATPRYPAGWWESRWFLGLLLLASLVPYAVPALPPLADLPGHYARFVIAADAGQSADLARNYSHEWKLVPNLGADLVVALLAPLLGVKLATKLVVMAVAPLTIAGFWLLCRVALGRIPPTFALVAMYAFSAPLAYGFVNFALAFAVLPFALSLWVAWSHGKDRRRRAPAFLVVASLLYVMHVSAWGVLGLTAFVFEWVGLRRAGSAPIKAVWKAALAMWPLCLPFLHLAYWMTGRGEVGDTGNFFMWEFKADYLAAVLRDTWTMLDLLPVLASLLLLVFYRRLDWRGTAFALSAGLLLLTYLLMPQVMSGSNFADMRLVPAIFMFVVLAPFARSARAAHWIAIAASLLALLRVAVVFASTMQHNATINRYLELIAPLDRGSDLFVVINSCEINWGVPRLMQLGAHHVALNHGYANSQWALGNASPLTVIGRDDPEHDFDPSQVAGTGDCGRPDAALYRDLVAHFPQGRYDYFLTVGLPEPDSDRFVPLDRRADARLYRIED